MLADGAEENAGLSAVDPVVTADVVGARTAGVTRLAEAFTFSGSVSSLLPLTLALLALLLFRRRWGAATAVATGMTISIGLTEVLKNVIGRARPAAYDVLGAVNHTYAFPSGHTLKGTVFFGLVGGLLLMHCRSAWSRAVVLTATVGMALGIGLSRVYLGYHWLTDVMAGWSLGIAVLGTIALGAILLTRPGEPHTAR
jgi:membrane-associated phospholipid phosphatase